MRKTRQNEDAIGQQEISCTELKLAKSRQKQRIFKKDESPVQSSGQEVNNAQLKFHRRSHLQHRTQLVRERRKDLSSTAWRKVAGISGVFYIVLTTVMGVLLSHLLSSKEEQTRKDSLFPTLSSNNNVCSRDLSSDNWIGYRNSCYHSFNEAKTWAESWAACAELNSHLLKIDTKEEWEFLSELQMMGWTAFNTSESSCPQVWQDVSQVKESLFSVLESKNHICAYFSRHAVYPEDCSSRKFYICQFNI